MVNRYSLGFNWSSSVFVGRTDRLSGSDRVGTKCAVRFAYPCETNAAGGRCVPGCGSARPYSPHAANFQPRAGRRGRRDRGGSWVISGQLRKTALGAPAGAADFGAISALPRGHCNREWSFYAQWNIAVGRQHCRPAASPLPVPPGCRSTGTVATRRQPSGLWTRDALQPVTC